MSSPYSRLKKAHTKWGLAAIIVGLTIILSGCASSQSKSVAPQSAKAGSAMDVAQSSAAAQPAAGASKESGLRVQDQYGSDMKVNSTSAADKKQAASANANTSAKSQSAVPAAGENPVSPLQPMAADIDPSAPAASKEGFNRKLIYKANLSMQVEDYGKAQSQVRDLVQISGGYILQFSENHSEYEQGGNYTIKVPSSGFSSFLDGLEHLNPLKLQRSIQGQDVSEEYTDLDSRLKAKQAVESRLLDFMDKATTSEDLLAFSDQLGKVQEEIEQIKGRMRYLDQNVAYSTIELRLYQGKEQPAVVKPGPKLALWEKTLHAALGSLKVLGSFFSGVLIFLAAALPVLLIAAIIVVPAIIYIRKRRIRIKELARSKLADYRNQAETE